jgi:hypothetical protein
METVTHIEDAFRRNIALHNIALIQTNEGNIRSALVTATAMDSELSRARLYADIATIQTRRGETKKARLWINKLTSPVEKSSALLGLVNGLLDKDSVGQNDHCSQPEENQ